MTSYRHFVLPALVMLVVGGWFGLARANARESSQYDGHLAAARASVELGVTSDAVAEFEAALAMRPSFEVMWEMVEFLRTDGDPEDYRRTLAEVVRTYPERPEAYLALARVDVESEELASAYATLVSAIDAGVATPEIESLRRELRYQYTIGASSYDEARTFVGDLAAIRTADGWIVVNGEGSSLSKTFDSVGVLSEGMINVVLDGRPVYIDRQGEVVLEAKRAPYVAYGPIAQGIVPARSADGRLTYLDNRFRPAFGDRAYADGTSFIGGLAAVSDGTSWSVVDVDGSTVAGPFDAVARSDGDAIVAQERFFARSGDGYRMHDSAGEVVGTAVYEDARPFSESGAAAVKQEGRWGFVDATGAQVVAPAYDDARSFVNGVAAVRLGDRWGYINADGEVVIPMLFAAATDFTGDGAAIVALRGLETGLDPAAGGDAEGDVGAEPPTGDGGPAQAGTDPGTDPAAGDPAADVAEGDPVADPTTLPVEGEPDVRDAIRWQMLKLKRFEE